MARNFRLRRAAILVAVFLAAFSSFALAQSNSQSLVLPPMLVPTEGSVASYLITETGEQKLTGRSGLFLIAPTDGMEEAYRYAVGARYTVLELDVAGQVAHLSVEAQALDPDTHRPLSGSRWEATYRVTPQGAEWESGHVIPDDYASLVTPQWLADWTLTPSDQMPRDEIRPGFRWQASPDMTDFGDGLPFADADLPLVGTFGGWEQLPDGMGVGARIAESVNGSASVRQELTEGMPGLMTFNLIGGTRYTIVPGAFPYSADLNLAADMVIRIGADTGAVAGLEGTVDMTFNYERTIRRNDEGPVTWFAAQDELAIDIGQSVTGTLGTWSQHFDDGTAIDIYTFYGFEGDTVSIRAESSDFDTYLMLVDVTDSVLAQDDDSAGGSNSLITYTLPYTGTYTVYVNSYWEGEYGTYVLSVDETSGPVVDITTALELIALLDYPEILTWDDLADIEEVLWILLDLVESYRQ